MAVRSRSNFHPRSLRDAPPVCGQWAVQWAVLFLNSVSAPQRAAASRWSWSQPVAVPLVLCQVLRVKSRGGRRKRTR
eukprot:scaffold123384_cov45-Phaeocystis_antarctica.AAC.1